MTTAEILSQLEGWGSEQTKKVLMRHGAKEPFWGVKVADLKKIVKKVKKDHDLALELYDTGNSDAMYLAGLIADETKMTKQDLQNWVEKAYWYYISDYAVAAVTAESDFGWDLALEWIEDDREFVASAGWSTLTGTVSIKQDDQIDLKKVKELLTYVGEHIHEAQNRVRYSMNGFVIAVGCYIKEYTELAKQIADKIGKVEVFMGETSCKVPFASEYITKVENRGTIGKKRKVARC